MDNRTPAGTCRLPEAVGPAPQCAATDRCSLRTPAEECAAGRVTVRCTVRSSSTSAEGLCENFDDELDVRAVRSPDRWAKMLRTHMPEWALSMLQNVQGCIVVLDSDFIMWRFESEHVERAVDDILSRAKCGNLLQYRSSYSEVD